jgi:hypothetical protein
MRQRILGALGVGVPLLALWASPAQAQSITIDVSRFGIYESFGQFSHSPDTGSLQRYDVGETTPGVEARDYFVFDLAGLNFTATSATLRIFSNSTPNVDAPDQTNNLSIFSVETPLATVTDSPEGTGDFGTIFADLGNGTTYGSTTLVAANIQQGTSVDIALSSALSDINGASGSLFGVGGTITDFAAQNTALYFSGGVFEPKAQLILQGTASAPEPSTAALAIGLLPLGGILVRRMRLAT